MHQGFEALRPFAGDERCLRRFVPEPVCIASLRCAPAIHRDGVTEHYLNMDEQNLQDKNEMDDRNDQQEV